MAETTTVGNGDGNANGNGPAAAGVVKPEHRVHGPGWLAFASGEIDVTKISLFVEQFDDTSPYSFTPELSVPAVRPFVRGLGVELLDVDSVFSTVEALIDAFNNVDWSGSCGDEWELSALATRKVNAARELVTRTSKALRAYAEYVNAGRIHDLSDSELVLLVNTWRSLAQRGFVCPPHDLIAAALRLLAAAVDAAETTSALEAVLDDGVPLKVSDGADLWLSQLKSQGNEVFERTGPWDALPDPASASVDDDDESEAEDDGAEAARQLVAAGSEGGEQ